MRADQSNSECRVSLAYNLGVVNAADPSDDAALGTRVWDVRGLLRNVCVVLGNIGTAGDLPALEKAALHEEPLVREHAAWAIGRIQGRCELDNQR